MQIRSKGFNVDDKECAKFPKQVIAMLMLVSEKSSCSR